MKKFMLPAIVAIAAASGIIGFSNQSSKHALNALALENLEALSYDEWGYDKGCKGPGDGCIIWPSYWYPELRGVDE